MKRYFDINFEPEKDAVLDAIEKRIKEGGVGYIAVCDGNVLSMALRDEEYRSEIDRAMFSIMDSSWIPLYVKMKYGDQCSQYCGSDIFKDITESGKYRQYFLGSSQNVLDGLKTNLSEIDRAIEGMKFKPLPFCDVKEFDYYQIASEINADAPEIIWLSLGAPKQERFAANLLPYLTRGVIIPVGAVFDFRSGVSTKRAPEWMLKCHMEFAYRIFKEPRKQMKRCWRIIKTLPKIIKYNGHSI